MSSSIEISNNKIDHTASVADKCDINNSLLYEYCNVAHHAQISDSIIGCRSSIGRYNKIRETTIGKYCSISWDVTIGAVSHPMERVTSHAFTYRKQFGLCDEDIMLHHNRTIIGNDVWIGCGAIVISGVSIGDGAVIGAGAVVTKNVAPYTIVAGIPAKIIRKRFDDETISCLERIKWWDFPDEVIKENIELFSVPLNKSVLFDLERLSK